MFQNTATNLSWFWQDFQAATVYINVPRFYNVIPVLYHGIAIVAYFLKSAVSSGLKKFSKTKNVFTIKDSLQSIKTACADPTDILKIKNIHKHVNTRRAFQHMWKYIVNSHRLSRYSSANTLQC